jgi:hypothetical protein
MTEPIPCGIPLLPQFQGKEMEIKMLVVYNTTETLISG